MFDPYYHVFLSEKRLYDPLSKANHRLQSMAVYERLFELVEIYSDTLTSLLVRGASSIRKKLCSYAKDQLPGGLYWDADKKVKEVLDQLKPSNDVCESILGMNDYLTTAIPNLHPMSRSNLIQVKRNKTLQWLSNLPKEEQIAVVDMAVKQRRHVTKQYKDEERERSEHRKHNIVKDNAKRAALKERLCSEKEQLSQVHLITTSQELQQELLLIERENISASKKKSKKILLLKTQVQIRRKVLGQTVPIVFTSHRKQRQLTCIVTELCEFINNCTLPANFEAFIEHPNALVGRHIKQRFKDPENSTTAWYSGKVLGYCQSKKIHTVVYEGDKNQYHFDLAVDLINGDLIVTD